MPQMKLLLPVMMVLAGLSEPGTAVAQGSVGRYEMVPLPPKAGSFENKVMILDTADGHLWQWWEAPAIGSSTPSNGITYLGKVTPGSTTSDVNSSRHAGPPEPLPPKH